MRGFTAFLMLLFLVGCTQDRTPCVYEIPAGYRGWVLIEYERADCPPLVRQGGKLYISVPASGYLCTSTALESGSARDEYFFVGASRDPIPQTARGRGGMIWAGGTGQFQRSGQTPRTYEFFFVGTESDLQTAPPRPELPDRK